MKRKNNITDIKLLLKQERTNYVSRLINNTEEIFECYLYNAIFFAFIEAILLWCENTDELENIIESSKNNQKIKNSQDFCDFFSNHSMSEVVDCFLSFHHPERFDVFGFESPYETIDTIIIAINEILKEEQK